MQRLVRGFLGRRACARLRRRTREFQQYWASVRIQVHMRKALSAMRVAEIRFKRQTKASVSIQRRARGWFGRVFARMYRIRLENIQLEDKSAHENSDMLAKIASLNSSASTGSGSCSKAYTGCCERQEGQGSSASQDHVARGAIGCRYSHSSNFQGKSCWKGG